MLDSGVVDENVQSAVFGQGLTYQRAALVGVGYVGLDISNAHTIVQDDAVLNSLNGRRFSQSIQDDVAARLGHFLGNAQPDPARRAGDQRGFFFQAHSPSKRCFMSEAISSSRVEAGYS
jgi:hypothetical protein